MRKTKQLFHIAKKLSATWRLTLTFIAFLQNTGVDSFPNLPSVILKQVLKSNSSFKINSFSKSGDTLRKPIILYHFLIYVLFPSNRKPTSFLFDPCLFQKT